MIEQLQQFHVQNAVTSPTRHRFALVQGPVYQPGKITSIRLKREIGRNCQVRLQAKQRELV